MKTDAYFEAFSSLYGEYDTLSRDNFIDRSRRRIIYNHVGKYLQPNSKVLELNSGSGIDAVYFAKKGHRVLATDISQASAKYIHAKSAEFHPDNLRFAQCSFTDLKIPSGETFDYIFSNFGGLNCTGELNPIFAQFVNLSELRGHITLVLMPKIYPWEILSILTGSKNAFRRFKRDQSAMVGGTKIPVFYHSPAEVKSAFPKNFRHISTQNIGTFYPSAHFASVQRYEKAIQALVKIDEIVNNWWIMPKGFGDYYIVTFQKISE